MNSMIDTNHIIIIYKEKPGRLDAIYGQTINLLPICDEIHIITIIISQRDSCSAWCLSKLCIWSCIYVCQYVLYIVQIITLKYIYVL